MVLSEDNTGGKEVLCVWHVVSAAILWRREPSIFFFSFWHKFHDLNMLNPHKRFLKVEISLRLP